MTTVLPTSVGAAIESITAAIELDGTPPTGDANVAGGLAEARPGPVDRLLNAVDDLGRFAGPAMAAPIREHVATVITDLMEAERERSVWLDRTRELDGLARRLSTERTAIGAAALNARDVLAHVGCAYVETRARLLELELLEGELVDLFDTAAAKADTAAVDGYTPAQAAAKVREARRRAKKAAATALESETTEATT